MEKKTELALPQSVLLSPKPTKTEVIRAMAMIQLREEDEEQERVEKRMKEIQEEFDDWAKGTFHHNAEISVRNSNDIRVTIDLKVTDLPVMFNEHLKELDEYDKRPYRFGSRYMQFEYRIAGAMSHVKEQFANARAEALISDEAFVNAAKSAMLRVGGIIEED